MTQPSPLSETTTVIPTSRRRGSTCGSTDLDYSSCLRVDNDISSRVRSPLLSRNDHCPSRTPFSSVEHLCGYLPDNDDELAGTFDFSTARSVAKQVRLESGRLSLPGPPRILQDDTINMTAPASRISEIQDEATLCLSKQSTFSLSKRSRLRSTSSANDLADNAKILAADLSGNSSKPIEAWGKDFDVPRLTLSKLRKRAITVPPPRAAFVHTGSSKDAQSQEPGYRPRNFSHTKSINYAESMERQKSIELLDYKYRAETSDIACFVNGCSPGPDECSKYPRHGSRRSKKIPPDHDGIKDDPNEAPLPFGNRAGLSDLPASFPKLTDGNIDKSYEARSEGCSISQGRDGVAENVGLSSTGAPSLPSMRSSVTSADVFPHALLSQQVAVKSCPKPLLSTTIVTNFVLPGPKALKSPLKTSVPQDATKESPRPQATIPSINAILPTAASSSNPCQSDVCGTCTPTNASLYSIASKISAYRHGLLKPSVPDNQFLDSGLPVPPVISLINGMSTSILDNGLDPVSQIAPAKRRASATLVKAVAREILKLPVSTHVANAEQARESALRRLDRVDDSGEEGHQSQCYDKDHATPRRKPVNAAYWGFVQPGEEVGVDPSSTFQTASPQLCEPVRVGENRSSLAEVAKDADAYLQSSSRRRACAFSTHGSVSNVDLQDVCSPEPQKSLNAHNGCNKEEYEEQDSKLAWNLSKSWKKDVSRHYIPIPPRTSSQNPDATLNAKDPQQLSFLPTYIKASRTSSIITLKSAASSKLRPRSSLEVCGSSITLPAQCAPLADDAASRFCSDEKHDRRNTVQWLRQLLTSSGPYETRLTALPPRTRRLKNSTASVRSHTAPITPVDQLVLTAIPDPLNANKSKYDSSGMHFGGRPRIKKKRSVTETFSKTICDLEDLLNEALHIAKQAADYQETEHVPRMANANKQKETQSQHDDSASSLASIHESLMSEYNSELSCASENGRLYEEELREEFRIIKAPSNKRATTNVPDEAEVVQRESGWPPTGRAATPFPPASFSYATGSPKKLSVPANPAKDNTAERSASSDFVAPILARPFNDIDPFSHRNTTGQYVSNKVSPGTTSPAPITSHPEGVKNEQKLIREYLDSANGRPRARTSGPVSNAPRQSSLVRAATAPEDKLGSAKVILSRRESPTRVVRGQTFAWQDIDHTKIELCSKEASKSAASVLPSVAILPEFSNYSYSFDGSFQPESEEINYDHNIGAHQHAATGNDLQATHEAIELRDVPSANLPEMPRKRTPHHRHIVNLKNRSHVSLRDHKGFSLSRSHKRQTIARDWSPARKRFSAAVACISTALVGILVGIYAGEVPAIQYYVVDFHHSVILGNVFFLLGLAISTLFFWPLPLLHGRKPYILGAMSLAMPLLFPQALAVGDFRSPYEIRWRICLLLPRALMGFFLGFANMNFKATLTDLFGASLQSAKPHQEVVDEFDVRRHGGGMGVWLGIWTWCCIGSIGIGFLIGAAIINHLNPAWGFYASICIIAAVLLLNVVSPEVRRSAYRRSIAEVKNGDQVSRRVARGEIKMHMVQTGPKWWGEEFHYGVVLSLNMLRQPGFLVMALYVAWMYGQMVLIIVLLGSLTSKRYNFKSPFVGLSVAAVPLGALLSVPFQKASFFSRSRKAMQDTDDETLNKKLHWSSHMVRRAIFILVLPFAGLAYTLTSTGPPLPFIVPIIFAGLIGFLSNLAMAECHGIIMETFDTSDLQPGMTGRPRGVSGQLTAGKRTNYSSFPRVTSAVAITEGLGYLFAAAATGVGGVAQRKLGQQASTGVMAGILLILSLLLLGVLIRFKEVQIIPDCKAEELENWRTARRASLVRRKSGLDVAPEDEPWRPVIIGNPTHSTRRMCVLELGSLSRFSEIRKKNKLIDQESLEAKHPNLAALGSVRRKLKEKELVVRSHVHRSLSRGSERSVRSLRGLKERFSGEGERGGGKVDETGKIEKVEKVEKAEKVGGGDERSGMRSGKRNGGGRRRFTEQADDLGGFREMGVSVGGKFGARNGDGDEHGRRQGRESVREQGGERKRARVRREGGK